MGSDPCIKDGDSVGYAFSINSSSESESESKSNVNAFLGGCSSTFLSANGGVLFPRNALVDVVWGGNGDAFLCVGARFWREVSGEAVKKLEDVIDCGGESAGCWLKNWLDKEFEDFLDIAVVGPPKN